MLVAALAAVSGMAQAQEKLKVVASFSILADLTKNVGGDRVEVSTLVGPGGDAHVYTPTPADARNVAAAKLVIVNGLGFEGWLSRLVKSAGNKATVITATKGITPRKEKADAHGHKHSHDHERRRSACLAVGRQCEGLCRQHPRCADRSRCVPAQRPIARTRTPIVAKLDALDREVREAVAKLPAERRKVISTHDAFGYFADAYGITFIAPQGVSTEAEATARDVARIITQIKAQKIPAVFLENVSDPRLMRRISQESGARLGGTLFSDSLTDEKGAAPTYIDMIRYNIKALTSALAD